MIELDEVMGSKILGIDYMELAEKWDVEVNPIDIIRNHIMDSITYNETRDDYHSELDPEVKADMIDFLINFISNATTAGDEVTIYETLLDISERDEHAFAQQFCALVPLMWV